ncbi:Tropomyosin [Citrus sinensis]|uniref:Tropomyosin n=1 Tax=Citrus sinensis TaxID=2711 RepID=A0ACB8M8M6_CITSI|nr:Tropomyosin [Citrus sinensis]
MYVWKIDVEDQAAKVSVEEQTQISTIQSLENDLVSGSLSVLLRFLVYFESDSYKLFLFCYEVYAVVVTLELITQERVSISSKLVEKSTYYNKVTEDISKKLQLQQDWVKFYMTRKVGEPMGNEARNNLMARLDSAKVNLERIAQMKSKLVSNNNKIKESVEQVKSRANKFKPELMEMDIKTLEEEHGTLQSDIAGEAEYLQSLQHQIEKLEGISHVIKCVCGQEYKVEVSLSA